MAQPQISTWRVKVMIRLNAVQRRLFCSNSIVPALKGQRRAIIIAALFTFCASFLPAASLSLPAGFATVLVNNGSVAICPQTFTASASCVGGTASASSSLTNNLGGFAQISLGPSPTSSGYAQVDYYIAILGPAGVNVPIIINGTTATSDGGAGSLSDGVVFYSLGQISEDFSSAYVCQHSNLPCSLSGGSFTLNETLASQTVYLVDMVSSATAGNSGASAMIDPLIQIDPSFALASEFTLVASSGVFAPAAPEPSSLGLLTSGLATGAFWMYRSRRQARTK
jgi:hypothetical protein